MSAPERIWAWVWDLPYPSRWQGKFSWGAVAYPSEQKVTEYTRTDLAAAAEARARIQGWNAAVEAIAARFDEAEAEDIRALRKDADHD